MKNLKPITHRPSPVVLHAGHVSNLGSPATIVGGKAATAFAQNRCIHIPQR